MVRLLKYKGSIAQFWSVLAIAGCSQIADLQNLASRTDPSAGDLPDAARELSWLEANPSQSLTVTASWKDSLAKDVFSRTIQLYEDNSCLVPAKPLIRIPDPKEKIFQFEGEVGKVYAFKIVSFNDAGKFVSSDCSPAIRIDDSAPLLTMTAPSLPGTMLASPSLATTRFQGVCSETGREVKLQISDSTAKSLEGSSICLSGSWSVDLDLRGLADGSLQTVTVHDNARKIVATLNRNVSKDTTAPTLTLQTPANGSLIGSTNNSTTYAVSGLCSEPGQPVEVLVNGDPAPGLVGGICNGTLFSATMDVTQLASGTYSVQTLIRDAALNQTSSATHSITKNLDVPSVTILSPVHLGFINNASDSASFLVTGSCSENNRLVQLVVNGSAAPSEVAGLCTSGSFSSRFSTTGLAQGAFTLKATTTSVAGNSGESSTLSLTKDTLAPTLAISSPVNASFINQGSDSVTYVVSGSCSENTRSVELLVNGSSATAWSNPPCTSETWSGAFQTTGLGQGVHTLTARHLDAAGNITTSSPISVTKDTVAPAAASGLAFSSAPYSTSASITAQWTKSLASDLGSQSLEFYSGAACNTLVGTTALGSAAQSQALSGSDGNTYSFRVVSFDSAGNSGASTCSAATTVDTGAPSVAIASPLAGIYINQASNSASYSTSGTCSENGRSVALRVNGSAAPGFSGGVCTSGSWSATFNTTGFAQGTLSLVAELSDAAGNTSSSTAVVVTKDTQAPSNASSLGWQEGSTSSSSTIHAEWVLSTATDIDAQDLLLYNTNNCSGTPTSSSLSKSDETRSVSGSDGQNYTFKIRTTDVAGNSSDSSCSGSIAVDTSFPSIALLAPANNSYLNASSSLSAVAFNGNCSENGRTVSVLVNGSASGTATCNSGNFSGTLDLSALSDGAFAVTARITDAAGNTTTSPTVNITKDTVAPAASSSIVLASGVSEINTSSLAANWTRSTSSDLSSQNLLLFETNNCSSTASSVPQTLLATSASLSGTDNKTYTFQVESFDAAGNKSTSSCSNATRVDLSAPSVAISAPVAGSYVSIATNSASFAVSGSCSENGRSVTLSVNGSAAPSFVGGTCSSGLWSAGFSTLGFADGALTLQAGLSDAAGNSATSTSVSVTKDTSAPTVEIAASFDGIFVGTAQNTTAYTLTGTCSENGRAVALQINSAAATGWTNPNCSSGGFSGTFNMTSLSDGSLSLVASQSDAASNSTDSKAIAMTKDTVSPSIALTTPAHNSFINIDTDKNPYIFQGTCSENGQSVDILLNGAKLGSGLCSAGSFDPEIDFGKLADGIHTFQASIEDAAGNKTLSAIHSVTLDTVAPTLSMTTPANKSYINLSNNGSSFAVSGNCSENGRSVTLSVNGSAAPSFVGGTCSSGLCSTGSWSATIDVTGLSTGDHLFSARLSDAAGNITNTGNHEVSKDTSAPVIAVTTPSVNLGYVNSTNHSSVTISGTCSENGRPVIIDLWSTGGGAGIDSTTACSSNAWSTTQNFTSMGDGIVTGSFSQDDAAGNSTTVSRTWTLDATRPTVTVNQASWQRDSTTQLFAEFTILFSEPVTGLLNSELVYPGTATATLAYTQLNALSSTIYRGTTVVTTLGRMELQVPAGVAVDAAGNTNLASTSTDNAVTRASEIASWQWLDQNSSTVGINHSASNSATQVFPFQADYRLFGAWLEDGRIRLAEFNNSFSAPAWTGLELSLPKGFSGGSVTSIESVSGDPENTRAGLVFKGDDGSTWAMEIDVGDGSVLSNYELSANLGGTTHSGSIAQLSGGGGNWLVGSAWSGKTPEGTLSLFESFGTTPTRTFSQAYDPPATHQAFTGVSIALAKGDPYILAAQGFKGDIDDGKGNITSVDNNGVKLYSKDTLLLDVIVDPTRVTGNTALVGNTSATHVYGAWIERNSSGVDIVRVMSHELGTSTHTMLSGSGLNKNTARNAKNVSLAWSNNKLYAAWSESNASAVWQLRLAVWNGNLSTPSWTFLDGNNSVTGMNKSTSHSTESPMLTSFLTYLVVGASQNVSGKGQAVFAVGW